MICRNEAELTALAARAAKKTKPGTVLCLFGDLGAGKTTFARGFLKGLGHRGFVPSPTFAVVNEYSRLRPPVYHMDLYRVNRDELENLGLRDYFEDPEAVSLVEWPEEGLHLIRNGKVDVRISHRKDGGRTVTVKGLPL